MARDPEGRRRAVDRQLLPWRSGAHPSRQALGRRELRLDLVEREGRRHQGAGKHGPSRDAGPNPDSAGGAGHARPASAVESLVIARLDRATGSQGVLDAFWRGPDRTYFACAAVLAGATPT